jgi:hypothetical protein
MRRHELLAKHETKNAIRWEEVPAKNLKVGDAILYLDKRYDVKVISRLGQGLLALNLGSRMLEYESDEMVQRIDKSKM